MPLSYRRCAVTITQSPVFQRCSLLCRSHQQEPPHHHHPTSYAARPIVSPSLGIDQRAGESQLWGREGAALITSARSTERLSATRGATHRGWRDVSRWQAQEYFSGMISVWGYLFAFCSRGNNSALLTVDTVHPVTWITLQPHFIFSPFIFFFILFWKMFGPKRKCASVGPTRSSLCHGCETFEFSALFILQ